MSPIFYRFIHSSTLQAKTRLKIKPNENGIYPLSEYKDIFIFSVINNLSDMKQRFNVDEVVLAIDEKPYWRKDLWSGYKHGRKANDKSGIDWDMLKDVVNEILDILDTSSSFSIIRRPGIEGDDVLFVLSKELSKRGHEVIVKSIDHDIYYCLAYKNVKYWQVKHAVKSKQCSFVEFDESELQKMKFEHVFFGDPGDYILPVTAFTNFSEKFREVYPDMTELKVWPKRFEIDQAFIKKYGISAYKHPRFGAKSYYKKRDKEGFTDKDFLDRNIIYKKNLDLNKQISLPEYIPTKIEKEIIEEYDKHKNTKNSAKLTEYFLKNNLFNLIGKISKL